MHIILGFNLSSEDADKIEVAISQLAPIFKKELV